MGQAEEGHLGGEGQPRRGGQRWPWWEGGGCRPTLPGTENKRTKRKETCEHERLGGFLLVKCEICTGTSFPFYKRAVGVPKYVCSC